MISLGRDPLGCADGGVCPYAKSLGNPHPNLAQNARLGWGTCRVFQKSALCWNQQFDAPWLVARGSKLAAQCGRVLSSSFGGGRQLFLAASSLSFTLFFTLRNSSSQSTSGTTLS